MGGFSVSAGKWGVDCTSGTFLYTLCLPRKPQIGSTVTNFFQSGTNKEFFQHVVSEYLQRKQMNE